MKKSEEIDRTEIGSETFRLVKKSFTDPKTGQEIDYLVVERRRLDEDMFILNKRYTIPIKATLWISEALKKVNIP